ncbi:type II toxin-antitoxin system HicB family antitoxin [Novosphingobium mangrovi (ex Huang et al. 2023)]|uniref:Type II toxin-antitoxin system HicB family antitoxin n=1 Tax=Novosphingobium mangrovi (ex Huang et al. 2023) TaxID=2976432 RepID=A0ABT2I6J3_9SPHN|nr:type II toxin-antitoxin system HicB family antitoxin [Novosphingobium mangrovi (ex Huang et al. 2023)]MCT2400421.1 type II toxin-antitoxin system HicB family antitoxin [Novosphingobium mangrovi (ex Huang et al. 2023)]
MNNRNSSDREFSGRFQIRINPNLHKRLFDLSNGMNCSINDIIEISSNYSLNNEDFINYLDDYLHGAVMIINNGMPTAHLVRRNVISFSHVDRNKILITFKVKRGSVWQQAEVLADLEQNPTILRRFKEWSIPN